MQVSDKRFEGFDQSRDESQATWFVATDPDVLVPEIKEGAWEVAGGGFLTIGNEQWSFFYCEPAATDHIVTTAVFSNTHPHAASKFWWDTFMPPLADIGKPGSLLPVARLTLEHKVWKEEHKLVVWFDLTKFHTLLCNVANNGHLVLMPFKPVPEMSWHEVAPKSLGITFANQVHLATLTVALIQLERLITPGKRRTVSMKK